ncbi:Ig-like domain repeat protein, partial [Methanobrevibacter sp.]|uniref:Ig-like domain repeat protein n=1 Tax=Methanobrevibacter sp. TaxID=66852 RepID=UPI0026E0B608
MDTTNVSVKEYSNLDDSVDTVSLQNKLEISNEVSISETNIVNSHDDNLKGYPSSVVLSSTNNSSYEDDDGKLQTPVTDDEEDGDVLAVSNESSAVSTSSSSSDVLSASKTSTKLSIADTSYSKLGTVFKVTLKDKSGKAIVGQKIALKVNGKIYSALSNRYGTATIKTPALKVGKYSVMAAYSGNSKYSKSSISKTVKVFHSVSGNDITKYYGYYSLYNAKFLRDGAALANTAVSFTVDGKSYKRTTDAKGIARLNIYLKVGSHVISSINPYSKEKLSNKILVKKDGSKISHSPSTTYIATKTKYVFYVSLKSKHNKEIKDGTVYFKYNNKTVTSVTDKNGKASIVIPALSKGTYNIDYSFEGSSNFYASSGSAKLIVNDPIYTFKSSKLSMGYKDGSRFIVKLLYSDVNNVAVNKDVRFIVDGKIYKTKTNSKGCAGFSVGNLKPGKYTVKFIHSSAGSKYFAYDTNTISISNNKVYVSAKNISIKYKDGSAFRVIVKDKSGNAVKNVGVKFTINGKSYTYNTNSKGFASIPLYLNVGSYTIKSVVSDDYYKSSSISNKVFVNGIKFVYTNPTYVSIGKTASFAVKAVDGNSNPIKNTKITFVLDGKKTYSTKTTSTGYAKVNLGVLAKGAHTIKFTLKSTSGASKIIVDNKVTLSQLITTSKYVKNYVENNEKLPNYVKIGGTTYSTADYLYLASKAIINLKSGSKADIAINHIANPLKPGAASYAGNLYDYLSVAKSVVKTADSAGRMLNSVSSKVGTIGYKGLVYAFARVVAFYGNQNTMPNYVTIKALSESTTSNLNSKNTVTNLASYLAASTNCQVNNAKIKQLVTKLTSGLTSEKAKAKAIFNYVRDTISYSFYYDTKYGAVGTLDAKT